MAKALSGFVMASAILLIAGHAAGQARDNYFARDRNVSVRERSRPGYEALGLPMGAFLAYPKIQLGVQADSNIYGQPNHQRSDAIGEIDPEIDLVSRWARNSLQAFVRTAARELVHNSSEDAVDWQVGGKGRLDLGDSTVNIGGDYGYMAEPRTASIGWNSESLITRHPVQSYQSDAHANLVHSFNRLQIEVGATYEGARFLNGVTAAGAPVAETMFDNGRTVISGKAGYAVSPDTAVYASLGYNIINYPNPAVAASYRIAIRPARPMSPLGARFGTQPADPGRCAGRKLSLNQTSHARALSSGWCRANSMVPTHD